jgi:hypothetical protein
MSPALMSAGAHPAVRAAVAAASAVLAGGRSSMGTGRDRLST